jgi:hypothetical protein
MAKKPVAYPPANQQIQITPAEWASWINELPNVAAGESASYSDFQTDDLPVIPPIINEAHQAPQNVITAETLKAATAKAPAKTHVAPTLQDQDLGDDDFDLPLDPETDENYTSLTKATSGPKHLERALYGKVNPLLVAEYVFAIADEATLAQAYGMTVPELRKTITTQPFQTAADSLRKAWETNPQLDTQYRAKQSFDYLLPIIAAQAADPKAHPGLKTKCLELLAKVGNVMPKENIVGGVGGNTFAIQIILPGAEKKEDDDFRIIDGSEV